MLSLGLYLRQLHLLPESSCQDTSGSQRLLSNSTQVASLRSLFALALSTLIVCSFTATAEALSYYNKRPGVRARIDDPGNLCFRRSALLFKRTQNANYKGVFHQVKRVLPCSLKRPAATFETRFEQYRMSRSNQSLQGCWGTATLTLFHGKQLTVTTRIRGKLPGMSCPNVGAHYTLTYKRSAQ